MPETQRGRVIAAFAAVYIIWGSTYLAIRFAIETMPPFLMAGARFLIAGALLYALMRHRSARPTARNWMAATIVGGFLLLGGNGGVVWAEQRVPSGIAALLVAVVPVWMVLLDWLRPGGQRPRALVFVGLVLGLAGIVLLVGPGELAGAQRVDLLGGIVLVIASLLWAIGSIYSRTAPLPRDTLLATAMEMLAGGALLTLAGLAAGEAGDVALDAVSLRSLLALVYLILFGSLIGYTAYIWLLGQVSAARVSTYAYVNPVVAVFLGWLMADEPLNARIFIAAAVIIAAVALITTARAPAPEPHEERKELREVA